MKRSLPLILSILSAVLLTVNAITFYCGGFTDLFPPRVRTVEVLQRDLEPITIAVRNVFLTAENSMAHKDGYQIGIYSKCDETICSFRSRTLFFVELDTDHIRGTYNKHLLSLGFKLSGKHWTSGGIELANFLRINEEYHAVVTSMTRLGGRTAMFYYTQGTPTDGSTGNPPQPIDQSGRISNWFDPNSPPADQK